MGMQWVGLPSATIALLKPFWPSLELAYPTARGLGEARTVLCRALCGAHTYFNFEYCTGAVQGKVFEPNANRSTISASVLVNIKGGSCPTRVTPSASLQSASHGGSQSVIRIWARGVDKISKLCVTENHTNGKVVVDLGHALGLAHFKPHRVYGSLLQPANRRKSVPCICGQTTGETARRSSVLQELCDDGDIRHRFI
jgi:hypothetical protein